MSPRIKRGCFVAAVAYTALVIGATYICMMLWR